MEKECQAFPLPLQNVFLMSIPPLSLGTQCFGSQGPSEHLGSESAIFSFVPEPYKGHWSVDLLSSYFQVSLILKENQKPKTTTKKPSKPLKGVPHVKVNITANAVQLESKPYLVSHPKE